jgi:ABC-type glycerol-3-phosphate transport system substrate-binding protein
MLAQYVMAGGGGQSSNAALGGGTQISIAVLYHSGEALPDWNLSLGQKVLKTAGVTVQGEYWPQDATGEKQNLALASGTLPDLFYATGIQANSYGLDGVFEALDDLLAKNAPNFMKLVNDSPDSPFLKNPDNGRMYFMPKYYSLNTATEATFTYRKDIL